MDTDLLNETYLRQLVAKARRLAMEGHAGQFDKTGAPYFEHVERVALACLSNLLAVIVGYLHDLAEDHPEYWPIIEAEFPPEVVAAVRLLDRTGKKSRKYYAAIKTDALALQVKLADLADNLREDRLGMFDPDVASRLRDTYRRALRALVGGCVVA